MSRRTAPDQMSLFVPSRDPADPAGAAPGAERPSRSGPPEGAPAGMWQVHDTYIFAQTRGGVLIIDQHSAHERILYERAVQALEHGGAESQRLLFPAELALEPGELAVVEEVGSLFARIGYELEPTSRGSVTMFAAPQPYRFFDAERCLRAVVQEMSRGSALIDSARTQHERLALSYACKASIRPGQRLSAREMSDLFDQLFSTPLPYQDVHGRPTVIQLPLTELQSRFRP